MKLGIILYGALGDVAALSALSRTIKYHDVNTNLTLITEESFSKFATLYGYFDNVIGFSRRDIGEAIRRVNDCCLEVLCDLHTSSYSDPEFIYWMEEIKVGSIRTPISRANLIRDKSISTIEELEDSLRIEPREEDKEYARLKKQEFYGRTIIGFVPNSMREHKKWDLKNWVYVSDKLNKNRFVTVTLCAGFEREEMIEFAERTHSKILVSDEPSDYVRNLLSTDLIVSIDTGPKHIAGYLNHPVISLYGHASPKIWGTLSSSEISLLSAVECSPCNNPFFCKYGKATCVDNISPHSVLQQIRYLIEER